MKEDKPNINFLSDIILLKKEKALNTSKAKSKEFDSFVMPKVAPTTCISRWLDQFGISNDSILKSMSLCKKSTRDPRLLAFRFKIVHNVCG